jgi:hypothetical protein
MSGRQAQESSIMDIGAKLFRETENPGNVRNTNDNFNSQCNAFPHKFMDPICSEFISKVVTTTAIVPKAPAGTLTVVVLPC